MREWFSCSILWGFNFKRKALWNQKVGKIGKKQALSVRAWFVCFSENNPI